MYGDVDPLEKHLSCKHEELHLIPRTHMQKAMHGGTCPPVVPLL